MASEEEADGAQIYLKKKKKKKKITFFFSDGPVRRLNIRAVAMCYLAASQLCGLLSL